MPKALLDTSFLIALSKQSVPWHAEAFEYFKYCVANEIPMLVSALAISEFSIKQDPLELPLSHFQLVPFNYDHSVLAAAYQARVYDEPTLKKDRTIVKYDVAMLAQGHIEKCDVILCRDGNTMAKWAEMFLNEGRSTVRPVVLKDGFDPNVFSRSKPTHVALELALDDIDEDRMLGLIP